ncbi:low affinity immunoglobulin gamma Fc region receptor II-like [Scleropages formosus]|uniref:low affinity immunoglobulin gamma Fc region receptor II-like n=1 Tax=Scleropages formosus TaxID=113540 RepID=UPI0010FA9EB2|nr:low affinity immunoglobulin gamma Fc region receptor II-like [Scleropages formosus]
MSPALPKAVLSLHSGWTEIFSSEKVTLRCDFQGSSSQWDYKWFKNGQELPNRNGDTLTIHSATQSDTALPKAVLSLQSGWTEIFPSEKVTLRCDFQGSSSQWDYKWFKNGQELVNRNGDTLTIHSAAQSDTGSTPSIAMRKNPSTREIYTGETVTLSCTVEGSSTDWHYCWYKDTPESVLPNTESSRTTGSSYTISSAALSHGGQYWCQAGRGSDPFYTNFREPLNLKITGNFFTLF